MIELPIVADHAKFAPSAASRWLKCNASVDFEDTEPRPQFVTDAAELGTRIHDWIASPAGTVFHFNNHEEKEIAELCSEWWTRHVPSLGMQEIKLFSKTYPTLLFGTLDNLYIDDNGCANIADLKTGLSGVSAANNLQLKVYAYIVFENFENVKSFKTTIIQPRRFYVESSTYTRDEIEAFGSQIKAAIESRATFAAGHWCEHCPNRLNCDTLESYLFGLLAEAKELQLWTPTGLTFTNDFCG